MKKTVKQQILDFLQLNDEVWHGGAIQRMDFTTRTGGNATGDNIKRRLNELVLEGKAFVSYNDKHEALFSANYAAKPKTQTVNLVEINGRMVAQLSYS